MIRWGSIPFFLNSIVQLRAAYTELLTKLESKHSN